MIRPIQGKNLLLIVGVILIVIVGLRSFGQQGREREDAPKNLKVFAKTTSGEEIKKIMKTYTKSLGVKCDHCHVGKQQEGRPFPKFDFASDEKPEKEIARKMIVMVDSINLNFLGKIKIDDIDAEKITCVTCHMGNLKPLVSVDSLMKK